MEIMNKPDIVESTSLEQPKTKVYKRRWYILIVFSVLNILQAFFVNTWGPIAETSEEAFDWTDGDVALLLNWAGIGFIISAPFFSWVINYKGLRVTTLSAAFLLALGTGISCITDKPPYIIWTANIGQMLNGLGLPAGMGLPPALSVVWFPPHERTTATALSSMLASLGIGASFIVGPYMVKDNDQAPCNKSSTICLNRSLTINDTGSSIAVKRQHITHYLYLQAGISVLIFLIILLYFPAKPKVPPSLTASLERLNFKEGLKILIKNKQFWFICASFSISYGFFVSWQSVLDINLKPHNISETVAGHLGLCITLAPVIPSVVLAWFADKFSKHLKLILISLTILTAGCLLWLSLVFENDAEHATASFYASIILGPVFITMTIPFYCEAVCEAAYPVSEGVCSLTMSFVQNIGITIFLLIMMIPDIGTSWINWCFFGGVAASIPLLCALREQYNRLEIDEKKDHQQRSGSIQ